MNGPIPRPEDLGLDVSVRGFMPGQLLFDRYRLRKILGRGGMGIVWQAADHRLERDVALKFVPDTVTFNPEALENLKRETRRSLQLTHPRIIRIYDLVQDDTWACISMEFIEGQTLSALKTAQLSHCFEVSEIQSWVGQLIEGLDYAHTKAKVIHRDLKPSNLMVTQTGELKIADFGIARTLADTQGQLTSTADASGTLVYMSPQQSNGSMPTVADDVYSLGATLYDLLSGKPPFFSGNIAYQVAHHSPLPLVERRRELGASRAPVAQAWEQTIAACLEKDPARRPASAAEVGRLLFGKSFAAFPAQRPPPSQEDITTELIKKSPSTGPYTFQKIRWVFAIFWNIAWVVLLLLLIWGGWRFGYETWQALGPDLKLIPGH